METPQRSAKRNEDIEMSKGFMIFWTLQKAAAPNLSGRIQADAPTGVLMALPYLLRILLAQAFDQLDRTDNWFLVHYENLDAATTVPSGGLAR